ncbi:Pimeloyl-ACP methyl ester carboxylesterase [Meinhardsimonia xiamenensis]|jgi:pimeloyl-ACP methyl ester carboxylesterase|uniref:Pimeloyl-ACP methyl ester carboxylesterase n=1 Tax=Meinhardsimonia xiamenensis TaxID=990712 RepID=A0A1G9CEM1_9RHOB|nr:alpha/beta fold hydrolase [Meinhardsimonia xiamenensis]PRX38387.1 pimeloyl-ACP methyl ester carboxylesterase [Meinhardsimonia xiamenensis]SDK50118.1 Pimeloyl-ACP methyl ester carboxylesterase [Meinhardsimonia xiamenensis]
MRLHTVTHGAPAPGKPPLLIAHGLFGSARNWGVIAKRLSDDRQVVAVDMRNHGQSPRAESQSYEDMAGDLADTIEALGGPMAVLGHSMGGKAAMVLALTRPELVERLIVADIAPVAYGHSQRHLIEAMRAVPLERMERRSDADAALHDLVDDPGLRAFLLQSLDVPARRWRLNLDVLDREMERITGWPDIDGRYDGPVLFLTGAESDYVRREHRDAIKRLFPRARFAAIPRAGHWLHADRPREFEAAVRAFLEADTQ